MSKTVVIYLDFEHGDPPYEITDSCVYNYLNELMENKCLDWEFAETTTI